MTEPPFGLPPLVERALRCSAIAHRSQHRKGTTLPYITHPFAVAWILTRHGWCDEQILAAALLHDVLEDTRCTEPELRDEFPNPVVDLVLSLSEQKTEPDGTHRSWEDRKRDHLAVLRSASIAVRAITLADKLHNLESMQFDHDSGEEVWPRFNAPRERILWYHRAIVDNCFQGESQLESLAHAVRSAIESLEHGAV